MKNLRKTNKKFNKYRPSITPSPPLFPAPYKLRNIFRKRDKTGHLPIKPKIILERWSVVSQFSLAFLSLITVIIAMGTFAATPAFRSLINPQPVVEAQVVESDNAFSIRFLLSNRGASSAAIRRAWLEIDDRRKPPETMLLTLKNEDHFLPPGHMLLASATATQGLIPSLIEDRPLEPSSINPMECTVILEIIRPDGHLARTQAPFPCLYASFKRSPPS